MRNEIIVVLRLVIVDNPPDTDHSPDVHRHNYIYKGFEALDETLRVACLEHDQAYAYDANQKIAECFQCSPPHWFCVPHVEGESKT